MVVDCVILLNFIVLDTLCIDHFIGLNAMDIFLIINKKFKIGGSYRKVLSFAVDVLQRLEKFPLELGH